MASLQREENPEHLKIRNSKWSPHSDPSIITEEYWDSLTEERQKFLHYYRNEYQKNAQIPSKEKDLVADEWDSKGVAAHNVGTEGNKDYRGKGKRAHQQAIYDKDGNLVTTPKNLGTYDKDGFPGKTTRRAVQDIQKKHGIKSTGIVDEATDEVINTDALEQ